MSMKAKHWLALFAVSTFFPLSAVEYKNQGSWEKTVMGLRQEFAKDDASKGFKPFNSALVKKEHRKVPIELDVRGVKRIVLTAKSHINNGSAHSIWGDMVLVYADGSTKPLTSMKILSSSVGWDTLRVGYDDAGRQLKIGGEVIPNAFWAHADSQIVIELSGNPVQLKGFCGLNDTGGGNGVRFSIEDASTESIVSSLEEDYAGQVALIKQYNEKTLRMFLTGFNDKQIAEELIKSLGPCSEVAEKYVALKKQNVPETDTRWVELISQGIKEQIETQTAVQEAKNLNIAALKMAIEDLTKTNPDVYDGKKYLDELAKYEKELPQLLEIAAKAADGNYGEWISSKATFTTSELVPQHSTHKNNLLAENNPAEWAFHSTEHAKFPWVTVDLGASKDIGTMVIQNRAGFASRTKDLAISVSDDNVNWTQIWSNNGALVPSWELRFDDKKIKARYVKFWLNTNSGTFHLRNIKIYAPKAEVGVITEAQRQHAEALKKIRRVVNLRREALLANPLLDFDKIIAIVRDERQKCLPSNWAGNSSLWGAAVNVSNRIVSIDYKQPAAPCKTIYQPNEKVFVGEVDLHFDANKMLFSMPKRSASGNPVWHIWELMLDEKGNARGEPRQITDDSVTDYDCYDPCYLPNGKIIFNATIGYQGVPCVNGTDYVGNLCIMNSDGSAMRRLTYDQDNNWDPVVRNDGKIMYQRWEYTDSAHYFSRMLFDMYPDGREQRAMYGSNSYWPNTLFYARPIPGNDSKFIAIVSGHHGVSREGELILFDTELGRHETSGVVQRLPGRGQVVEPIIMDEYISRRQVWPRFLHPYPLSDKYFIVSGQPTRESKWGIYLIDVYDNMLLLKELPKNVVFEPIPFKARETPPIIPDGVNLNSNEATVYISDVYVGPGLAGVPKGTVKELVIYAYEYAFREIGNHDAVGFEGPWDIRKVIGTVPVYEDGSASFKIPANVPVAVLPLDANGCAMQLFRSWFVGVPGEIVSCVGCHENRDTPPPTRTTIAYTKEPVQPKAFKGPFRGFSFEREVQPVLDKYCVGCHNKDAKVNPHFTNKAMPNFAPNRPWVNYERGWWRHGNAGYNQSYMELMPYIRRNGGEGVWYVLTPLEFHFGATQLGQMLMKGHKGVKLDRDSWERLTMWVNMNLPNIGRWAESEPAKVKSDKIDRIRELRQKYAGVEATSEDLIVIEPPKNSFIMPRRPKAPTKVAPIEGWPMSNAKAKVMQENLGKYTDSIMGIDLVKIPAGKFLMGNPKGSADENQLHPVEIKKAFWMGKTEISLKQYRQFKKEWKNGFYDRHWKDQVYPGYNMDTDENFPVIRISYNEAEEFCKWLSEKTGKKVRLPTEAEWEWACRAGSDKDFYFGNITEDGVKFGVFANLADAKIREMTITGVNPQPVWRVNENNYSTLPYTKKGDNYFDYEPYDTRVYDGHLLLAPVGSFGVNNPYAGNAWGLLDMHGNVAEWTSTPYAPYGKKVSRKPGFQELQGNVVRGGSWYDRPYRATAGFRLAYPVWQKPFNVGFRIVVEE